MGVTELKLNGSYDPLLVILSIVIAVFGAYTALDLADRMTLRNSSHTIWVSSGAIVMGIGIWSMHYIGMLAFRLPVPILYDWPTVLLSLFAAILASAIALFVSSREKMSHLQAGLGSFFMGCGIASMHYIGMEAMRMPAECHYSAATVTSLRGIGGFGGRGQRYTWCFISERDGDSTSEKK